MWQTLEHPSQTLNTSGWSWHPARMTYSTKWLLLMQCDHCPNLSMQSSMLSQSLSSLLNIASSYTVHLHCLNFLFLLSTVRYQAECYSRIYCIKWFVQKSVYKMWTHCAWQRGAFLWWCLSTCDSVEGFDIAWEAIIQSLNIFLGNGSASASASDHQHNQPTQSVAINGEEVTWVVAITTQLDSMSSTLQGSNSLLIHDCSFN